MKITKDKYELPIAIADTPTELAKIVGTTAKNVYSGAWKRKKGLKNSSFIMVEV